MGGALMANATVLVVDDEMPIRRALSVALGGQGFAVDQAGNGQEAIQRIAEQAYDVVILDLIMPGMDGLAVLRSVRDWTQVPVIVLSARGREQDKVQALDLGADDYLVKPFGMEELVARMRAVLRRAPGDRVPLIAVGPVVIDLAGRSVSQNGIAVHLTPTEFELVRVLAENLGKVMTHGQLMQRVWGHQSRQMAQVLRVYINALRHKLEADPANPVLIRTEAGVGYRMVEMAASIAPA
jgi:two-component system KDP operon response regulator KdpE